MKLHLRNGDTRDMHFAGAMADLRVNSFELELADVMFVYQSLKDGQYKKLEERFGEMLCKFPPGRGI